MIDDCEAHTLAVAGEPPRAPFNENTDSATFFPISVTVVCPVLGALHCFCDDGMLQSKLNICERVSNLAGETVATLDLYHCDDALGLETSDDALAQRVLDAAVAPSLPRREWPARLKCPMMVVLTAPVVGLFPRLWLDVRGESYVQLSVSVPPPTPAADDHTLLVCASPWLLLALIEDSDSHRVASDAVPEPRFR